MFIDLSSARVPIHFERAVNKDLALVHMGEVEILVTEHAVQQRIASLQAEGWPDSELLEEQRVLEALKNYEEWPETFEA
jgi:hypothetical protein